MLLIPLIYIEIMNPPLYFRLVDQQFVEYCKIGNAINKIAAFKITYKLTYTYIINLNKTLAVLKIQIWEFC